MNLTTITSAGKTSTLSVQELVFGVKPNLRLLAQAVHVYLSNQRQGTSKVKTRSDINRTKKKWFKQKGTGNARHGARTPNIFVGGGISHGPNGEQNWSRTMSKSQKLRSMIYALSAQTKIMVVCDDVQKIDGKTKSAVALFKTIAENAKHVLVVTDTPNAIVIRSTNNLENVLVTNVNRINVYELLMADKIVLTESAVKALEGKFIVSDTPVEKPAKVVKAEVKAPVKKEVTKKVVDAKKEVKKVAPKKTVAKKATAAKK